MADVREAVGATARLFWIYQAFALAAALLAFLPDRSATYTQAISELRRVASIQVRADDVDAALARPAERAIGERIFKAFEAAARKHGLTLSASLKANSSYLLIDKGPQTLNFSEAKVGDILDALDAYAGNPHYFVLVPEPAGLEAELQRQFASVRGVVTSFSIPCNYAPDRCQGDVYVNPNGDMAPGAQHDLEFYTPRVRVELDFGTRDLIAARYPSLGAQPFDTPALEQLRDDLAELAPGAAIAKLQELRKAEDRPISIFDVSLSGSAARLVAPMVLAVLALIVWASASGLKGLGNPSGPADTMFLPLIPTPPAMAVRWGSFWFPLLVGEGLLLRAWSTGLFGWLTALAAIILQSWAVLAMFKIFEDLRLPRAPRSTGWRVWLQPAAVTFSVMLAIGWSVVPASIPDPLTAPVAKEWRQDVPTADASSGVARQAPVTASKDAPADPKPDNVSSALPQKIEADEAAEAQAVAPMAGRCARTIFSRLAFKSSLEDYSRAACAVKAYGAAQKRYGTRA